MNPTVQRTTLLFGAILLLAVVCYLPAQFNSPAARARDDGVARTPPMGWNSWNRFGCDVNEWLIKSTADAMVASGMRDAGYQYVVVDDCWQVRRNADGAIVADPQRFPSGMAALADYIHARGLKFGLYTDVGSRTCQGRPGSLGHEWQDATTYASMWAMMAAPLIAGNDLTRMSNATPDILLNSEVIAIDQDARGTPALIVHDDNGRQAWSRPLSDSNARAVALFNPTDTSAAISVRWADIGLAPGDALVRDLWAHAYRGIAADSFTAMVEPHGTLMLKITAQPSAAATVPDPAPPTTAPATGSSVRYPYLSDLTPTFAENGLGPIEIDISNGEGGSGDGHTIILGGTQYAKGLGVHTPSDVRYDLGATCTAFAADIGLDAEVGLNGTAVFQVWADGTLIYDSGALHGGMAPVPVYLDVPGVHELRLVVAPVDWVIDYAHADWANARVACSVA